MKRLAPFVAFFLLSSSAFFAHAICAAQSPAPATPEDAAARKSLLLADLQALEVSAAKLDQPLARAAARAEIASAAWTLDEGWSKKLLRDAYEATLPDEPERRRLRAIKIGAQLDFPSGEERARSVLRSRVLSVAARDREFADELIKLVAQEMGAREQHYANAQLASRAAREGDFAAAGDYAMRALDAEPTMMNAAAPIAEVATRDRKAADEMILRYIERLSALPLSLKDRTILADLPLDLLVLYYNHPFLFIPSDPADAARYQRTQPPGPEVMRAYVSYVVESTADMERREPGSAQRERIRLGMISNLVRRYAPELTPAFAELERLSRRPGDNAPLPTFESYTEDSQKQYERRVKDALASAHPDETVIMSVVSRGDFDKARKLIAKLDDGPQKTQLAESLDARQALDLLSKGDALAAEQLAERLRNAAFILQVYPPLVRACVAAKDEACPARLVYQAVRQLKRADTTPLAPPAGVPASAIPSNRELDRVLMSLSQLAAQVAPASDALALELLGEIVEAANRSELDTGQGRTGFDAEVFRLVAARNEERARQAAEEFKDRLRRIVALAAVDQVKARELDGKAAGTISKAK